MFNSARLLDILSITDQLQNITFPIVRAVYSAPGKSRITCIGPVVDYQPNSLMRWIPCVIIFIVMRKYRHRIQR